MKLDVGKIAQKVKNSIGESSKLFSTDIVSFVNNRNCDGDFVLFGGFLRDLAFEKQNPRDIDIVFDGTRKELQRIVSAYSFEINRFGGFRLILDGTQVDIWLLDDTLSFRENDFEPGVDNLVNTTLLSCNSIAYSVKRHELIVSQSFVQTYENGLLDLVFPKNPDPLTSVARAMRALDDFVLKPSDVLRDYIMTFRDSYSLKDKCSTFLKVFDSCDRADSTVQKWGFF